MNRLWLLSPESIDQCYSHIGPNTCYAVAKGPYTVLDGGNVYIDFIGYSGRISYECLTSPNHLLNGGRWLLLEQLP